MKKIVFLEGLPGVGKTTLVNAIRNQNIDNVHIVDEIIHNVGEKTPVNQEGYFLNDEMKLASYSDGLIIIDRGPISTLSYNITRSIIDVSFDPTDAINWFEQFVPILKDKQNRTIYLTTKGQEYLIPFTNKLDPFGAVKNQKLLEKISLENCKKYAANLEVKEYHKKNMEELIDEIVA